MRCVAYSSNDSYKYRLAKTRENVLNDLYERKAVEQKPKRVDNLRLRLRFKEAIQEAQDICQEEGEKSKEVTSRGMKWTNLKMPCLDTIQIKSD